MRATYRRLGGTETFLGFYDVHADVLSGIFPSDIHVTNAISPSCDRRGGVGPALTAASGTPQDEHSDVDVNLTLKMTWAHTHPPCGPTTDHSDVTVTFTVSDKVVKTECSYRGSASGKGPECKP